MGYSEFVEWTAYYAEEPFGEARGDIQAALIAATIVNVNRKKGSRARKISEFLIDWWNDKAHPRNLLRKFRGIAAQAEAEAKKAEHESRNVGGGPGRRDRKISKRA